MSVHQAWTSISVVALCCVCNRNEKGHDYGGRTLVCFVYVLSAIAMFFDVMGGQSWDEDQRRGWKTLPYQMSVIGQECRVIPMVN